MNNVESFSKLVKEQRLKKELTQVQLARKVKMTQQQISLIEKGGSFTTGKNFMKILKVLDLIIIPKDRG